MRRLWWCWLIGAVLTGCAVDPGPYVPPQPQPTPWEPVPPRPSPPPQPQPNPVPPPPPVDAGRGVITQAQFDAVATGALEADTRNALGAAFQEHDAAGFRILTYRIGGTSRTVFVWLKDGKVDHKGTAP